MRLRKWRLGKASPRQSPSGEGGILTHPCSLTKTKMTTKPKLTVVEETHQRGLLSIENLQLVLEVERMDCDVGLQTSADGRIWLCVNGVAFIRFKPSRVINHNINKQ